jgi:hypothetical protein
MSAIGRNDPCPCGSGRKYKKCCLSKEAAASAAGDFTRAERGSAWRPKLISLLRGMDSMAERQRREGMPAYDFGWIWGELGLNRPG